MTSPTDTRNDLQVRVVTQVSYNGAVITDSVVLLYCSLFTDDLDSTVQTMVICGMNRLTEYVGMIVRFISDCC